MATAVLKNQKGFTLIELLAVMAIVAVLAGIISIAVGGSGETSRNTQTKQDATTVESAAADFFSAQEGAEVLSPKTVQVLGVSGIEQITSSRWPEDYISNAYPEVFTKTVTGGTVNTLFVLRGEDSTTPIAPKQLLENFNAVDFGKLIDGDFLAEEPDGATNLSGNLYNNYLWLLERTTAAGGSSEGATRKVAVFKLVSVEQNEFDDLVDLTYEQLVGEFTSTPELSVSLTNLDFGTSDSFKSFDITNTGDVELIWTISKVEPWLTVSPTSGSTNSEVVTNIAVTVNRTGLSPDTYLDTITVTSNGGTKTVSVSLEVTVPSPFVLVVPNSLANSEGNSNNALPFGPATRYQQIYAASEFPSGSGLITHITYRPDSQAQSFFGTIADIQINFSTTSATTSTLSTTFADNVGADETVVFSRGSLSFLNPVTGPFGGRKTFSVDISLQSPFLYDPAAGDLLVDIRNFSGGIGQPLDSNTFFGQPDPPIARAVTFDGVDETVALLVQPVGLVTQFTIVPQ